MGILRLFLALSVAAGHTLFPPYGPPYGITLFGGPRSVLVFFAVSGFLIAATLCGSRYRSGHWLLSFWLNRALRIYPSYLIVLGITVLCGWLGHAGLGIGFGDIGDPWKNIVDNFSEASLQSKAIIVFSNLTTISQDALRNIWYRPPTGEFVAGAKMAGDIRGLLFNVLGQAWSIGVEVLFYVLAPFIVRRAELVATVLLLCALLPNATYPFEFGSSLPFFLTGAACYHLYATRNAANTLLTLVAFLMLGAICFRLHPENYGYAKILLLIASIPFCFELSSRLPVVWRKIDTVIGDMSYPVYLVHFVWMQTVFGYDYLVEPLLVRHHSAYQALLYYGGCLVLAVLLALFVEVPMERYRHRLGKRLTTGAQESPLVLVV